MFAEIINKALTTSAWAEIKPTKDISLANIIAQAEEDGGVFKLCLTDSDSAPYWTVKSNSGVSPGPISLKADTRIIYAKAVGSSCTAQIIVGRR